MKGLLLAQAGPLQKCHDRAVGDCCWEEAVCCRTSLFIPPKQPGGLKQDMLLVKSAEATLSTGSTEGWAQAALMPALVLSEYLPCIAPVSGKRCLTWATPPLLCIRHVWPGPCAGTLHFLGALFTVARLSHAAQVSMPSLPQVMRGGGFLTTIGLLVLMGFLATAALRQT